MSQLISIKKLDGGKWLFVDVKGREWHPNASPKVKALLSYLNPFPEQTLAFSCMVCMLHVKE